MSQNCRMVLGSRPRLLIVRCKSNSRNEADRKRLASALLSGRHTVANMAGLYYTLSTAS